MKSQQFLKFCIGMFAGLCATIVPKMVTALATSDPTGTIVLFGGDYLMLSVALSVLLGVSVMILKWQEPCLPQAIFYSALGLPALIAGSFNMSASLHTLDKAQWQIDRLNAALHQEAGVNTYAPEPLMMIPNDQTSMLPEDQSFFVFRFVATAYAQEPADISKKKLPLVQKHFDPGKVLRQPQFIIVIKKTNSVREAKEAWKKIEPNFPGASIVKGTSSYYVIESAQTKSRTDATLRALELRRKFPKLPIGLMRKPGATK